jgi:hypothetical protein
MTSSKSARRIRREERRRRAAFSAEPRTEPITGLRTADYDATTVIFTGASDAGLADGDVYPHGPYPDPAPPAEPAARLRARPPQQPPPAGYSATTGPMPAIGRLAPAIGDALTRDETWGPKLAPLPCGHCGTAPEVPDDILERTRIIGHVNWLAARDGWRFDYDWIWTCPQCQQAPAWRARQGQMEVRLDGPPDAAESPEGTCYRHDRYVGVPLDTIPCTCPAAVLATDVMLTSHDYLRTGRAISIQILRDTQAGAR